MKTVIVGAGINGLMSAYHLASRNHEVEVLEAGALMEGASHGNAGYISPGHVEPVANMAMLAKGLVWMFQPKSPFYIKPRLDMDLAHWLVRFLLSCRATKAYEARVSAQAALGALSQIDYGELEKKLGAKTGIIKKGLLYVTRDPKILPTIKHEHEISARFGVETEICSTEDIKRIEPGMPGDLAGGLYFKNDWHCNPSMLMAALRDHLLEIGVVIRENWQAASIDSQGGKVQGITSTDGRKASGDNFLFCAGSQTSLLRSAGVKLLIQPAKGYSITLPAPPGFPQTPLILLEAKLAITPMGDLVRFGGTLELSGHDDIINQTRIDTIIEKARLSLPDFVFPKYKKEDFWFGYRPLSFDTIPYIGKAPEYSNLYVNAGHGMLGLTQGAGSGKLIAEIITGENLSIEGSCFRVGR